MNDPLKTRGIPWAIPPTQCRAPFNAAAFSAVPKLSVMPITSHLQAAAHQHAVQDLRLATGFSCH